MTDEKPWAGSPENFTSTHVEDLVSRRLVSSKVNLEKAMFALEYVAQLQESGLGFVFKGGSAVQILLGDRWNRLSVDVDICTDATEDELNGALGAIECRFGGRGFSCDARETEILGSVPFYSYRVTTPALTDKPRVILLDTMGLKTDYATTRVPLKTFFYESTIDVTTPTVGSMLGDKLTTIGPKTVGRIMRDSRSGLEYAKHLYDINALSHADHSHEECIHAYSESVSLQSRIRCRDFTIAECVDDAVFICQVASLPQTPAPSYFERLDSEKEGRARSEHEILRKGLRGFLPFLVRGASYTWDHLRENASRTALLTKMVKARLSPGEAKEILGKTPPYRREEIQALWNELEALRLPADETWFIDPREILNFPSVLQAWYQFYTI